MWEILLKSMSKEMLIALLPAILTRLGAWYKNKDQNTDGVDDFTGDLLIAFAPFIQSLVTGKESAAKKLGLTVWVILGKWLGKNPTSLF